MEREILFRGKRLDNGEWVYGFFWKDVWGDGESCFILCDGADVEVDIEIDPATRGQYTGLTDKNGKKIFEGDIIRNVDTCSVFEVIYKGSQFIRKDEDGISIPAFLCLGKAYEVIGNIHDNPGLLEVQHETD